MTDAQQTPGEQALSGPKKRNAYVHAVVNYDDTPKAVWAAIAFSLALRLAGNDSNNDANLLIAAEWDALYQNQIVPQKPRGSRD